MDRDINLMAKPNRTLRQNKPLTPAQKQRQRDQIAREKTEQLEHQMYQRTLRRTRLALVRQQARADALREAGGTGAKKPLAKAPKSGRKPQNSRSSKKG